MKKYLILLFVAAAAAFQSCDNNDDLWDAVDDLKSRVQALETQVNALNDNVKALQTLYAGATVSDVKNEGGKCTITLTDGKKLTLVSDIDALVPVVSIIDGYWYYSIGGGEPQSLNVKAVAEDGKTPTFQVADDGSWQVDLGDGQGWRDVTYADGSKVSAITDTPTEDKFFQTVEVVGDSLHIVMQNGEVLDVPIVKGFLCQIVDGEGNVITDVQSFDMGVTKEFAVNMRGVENWILTAPEGWTAELSEPVAGADDMKTATLSVTSPAPTRATASTAKDVSILASSGKYSCIAKIQVESTGIDPNAPRITVSTSTSVVPTYATLTFDVVLTNATTWKYICQPSSEQAPTADEIMSTGTEGSGTSVTVSGLEGETDYTIYMVAYADDQVSDVASAQNRTLVAPVDYYTKGVEVNGSYYDQNSEGARLLEFASDATEDKLQINLPGSATVSFIGKNESSYDLYTKRDGGATISADHIFIGRYTDERPVIKIGNYIALRNVGGTVAFKNLVIDCTETPVNYSFLITSNNDGSQVGGLENLIFEDCEIIFSKPAVVSLSGAAANSIGNMIFRNCKIAYTGTANSNFILGNMAGLTGADGFKSLVFENNIIYMTNEALATCVLFNGFVNSSQDYAFSNMAIKFTHNTVVNYLPSGGQGAVIVAYGCKSYDDMTYNLFYSSPSLSRGSNVFGFRMNGGVPSSIGTMTPNVGYGVFSKTTDTFKNYYGGEGAQMTIFSESPFSNMDFERGVFVKTSEAAEYGSTLQ